MYAVPTVPPSPIPLKFATPPEAIALYVPTLIPPALTVAVTSSPAPAPATTLALFVSRISITGCVVKALPATAPAAWVVTTILVGVFAMMLNSAEVTELVPAIATPPMVFTAVKVKVCAPPVVLTFKLLKVAAPDEVAYEVVPASVPSPDALVAVIV